jgi:CRP/FNR family cyclic AMP-dependent transcriptional regulator
MRGAQQVKQIQLQAGEQLITENSDSDYMYFVMEGRVEIYMMLNGERTVLAECSKGDEFGELGLLLNTRRSASAAAVEPSTLVALDQSELIQKIKREPDFAVKIIRKLARKVANANDVIKEQISLRRSLEIAYGNASQPEAAAGVADSGEAGTPAGSEQDSAVAGPETGEHDGEKSAESAGDGEPRNSSSG